MSTLFMAPKKTVEFIVFFSLLHFATKSQNGLFINGNSASLLISSNNTLYVNGDIQNLNASPVAGFTNNGKVILTGNLVNNDSLFNDRPSNLVPGSSFIFTGSINQTIRGPASTPFFKLVINKPGGELLLQRNILIKDTLTLTQGNINLNGKNIEMRYPSGLGLTIRNPFIFNENNSHRIYGDSGYVFVSTIKDVGKPDNLANIGLSINDDDSKSISIKRRHVKQLYAGNGSIKRYFDVSSNLALNTGINDSLFVKYIDNAEFTGLGINSDYFKMFVSPGSDMDYSQLPSIHLLGTDEMQARTADLSSPEIQINLKQFRITVADNNCSNPPVSQLTSDTIYLCMNDSIRLDAGNQTSIPNSSLKWKWSTGASTQSIWAEPTGSYQNISIKLTDVRGCTTDDTVIVAPTAPTPFTNFTHTNACIGDSILITKTSSVATGTYTSYWQFGDESNSHTSASQFKKLYSTAGKFYVSLQNTSKHGCISNKLDSIIIFPQPTADYTSAYNCDTKKMEFTDASTANFGSINSWLWNTGEGLGDTVYLESPAPPSIVKEYTLSGTYSVSLVVTTFQGCKDTVQKEVVVAPATQAGFSANNECLGDTVALNNTSVCNTGSCNYQWDFGDGSSSTQTNPKKKYNGNGVYNIKLKISSLQGCSDSITKGIFIHPLPATDFSTSANEACLGSTIYFTNQSNITTGDLSYLWDFGNGNTSASIHSDQHYGSAAVYAISLTAISDSGCTATTSKTIAIRNNPVAQYQADTVCLGQATVFNSTSTGIDLTYNWNLGNGATSSLAQPVYFYTFSGSYNTQLIVIDNYGCSDTTAQTAFVNPLPIAVFGGNIYTCGDSYILNAEGTASNYLWLPANQTTPSLQVTQSGTYTLRSTDVNGCSASEQVNVTLNAHVQPNLGDDTTVCGNYSLNAGYPGSHYLWNTGEISQSIEISSSGTYSLEVTDQNNCTGYDSIQIILHPAASVSLGNDIEQCNNTGPVILTATNAQNYLWNTGDTTSFISVDQSGTYWTKGSENNGCSDYDTIQVNFKVSPVVNLGNNITACSQVLLDAQNIGCSYLWSNGSIERLIQAENSNNYWVEVTSQANGCSASDTIEVIIENGLNVFLGNDTTVCSTANFTLDAGNSGANYLWNTGSTMQTIGVGSSGIYFVMVSKGSCTETDYINMGVSPAHGTELGSDIQYICASDPVQLSANVTGNYIWGSSNGFISNDPTINITEAGKYWLTIEKNGCTASDTVNAIASPYPVKAYFLASTTDSINKPVQFVDLSEPTPLIYYWDFGDGFYSNEANPVHTFLQAQLFDVRLKVSNGYCSDQINKTLTLLKKNNEEKPQLANRLELIDFKLYPNPASENFHVQLTMNDYASLQLYLYDINGKLRFQYNAGNVTEYSQTINVANLFPGFYILRINAQSRKGIINKTIKIVKTN